MRTELQFHRRHPEMILVWLAYLFVALQCCSAPPLFFGQNQQAAAPELLTDSLVLQLDPSDAAYRTLTGSSVDAWTDKNGSGISFTGSGAARPTVSAAALNGHDVFAWDGVDDALTCGSTTLGKNVSGLTVYVVAKWSTIPTSQKVVLVSSTATSTQARVGVYGALLTSQKHAIGGRRVSTDSFGYTESSSSIVAGSWFIQCGVFDYANSDLFQYIDGSLDGSNTSFQASGVTDNVDSAQCTIGVNLGGGSGFADVSIAYILIYHAVHGSTERDQVLSFLNYRFGF